MSCSIPNRLIKLVRNRAQDRCEYCQMYQKIQGATFHIEHVAPIFKGGKTRSNNLALACPSCNFYKSSHTENEDPISGETVRLFHPRKDQWSDHFQYDGIKIVGVTEIGRATANLLRFNEERRLRIREVERLLGWYPK